MSNELYLDFLSMKTMTNPVSATSIANKELEVDRDFIIITTGLSELIPYTNHIKGTPMTKQVDLHDILNKIQLLNNTFIDDHWSYTSIRSYARQPVMSLAVAEELGEVLKESGYAWWKGTDKGTDKITPELVDVLHFVAAILVKARVLTLSYTNFNSEVEHHEVDERGIASVLDSEYLVETFSLRGHFELAKVVHTLSAKCCSLESLVERYIVGNSENPLNPPYSNMNITQVWGLAVGIVEAFVCICDHLSTYENVDNAFGDKYVVNEFRQSHGRAEGTYSNTFRYLDKMYTDNELLHVLSAKGIHGKELLHSLTESYSELDSNDDPDISIS